MSPPFQNGLDCWSQRQHGHSRARHRRSHIHFDGRRGCQVDTTLSLVIHELPTFGNLSATPDAVCSGEEIQLTFEGIGVDDNLDLANATYNWSVSVAGSNMPVTGDESLLTVTPTVNAVVAASFTEPTPVVFQLTAGAGGCLASQTWNDLVHVYPAPRIQNGNPYACQDQAWTASITGPETLMTLGQNGLDSLVWEDNGAGQFDVTLPPDYLVALGGQTVQTFTFQGTIEYEDVGLTCVSNNTLDLNRRLAAPLSVTGDDTSGPAGDLVMCEGADLTLNSFVDQNGTTETFSWQVANGYPQRNQRRQRLLHRRASSSASHLSHSRDWSGHRGVF